MPEWKQVTEWGTGISSLGVYLVARKDGMVCWLALGDDRDTLVRELFTRFERDGCTELTGEEEMAWLRGIARHVEGDALELPPQLRLDGTPFQQQVWRALMDIPAGETRSYGELAVILGQPAGAARAIGTACGANHIAILVPCHRVVKSDGGLGGFRWGIDRKRQLLAREASQGELL